jgi:hypothetical protein
MVWDCLIVGLLWLHHTQSLTNATMATNVCNLLQGKNDKKAVVLPSQPEIVYCREKRPKGVAGFMYKPCMDIF